MRNFVFSDIVLLYVLYVNLLLVAAEVAIQLPFDGGYDAVSIPSGVHGKLGGLAAQICQ